MLMLVHGEQEFRYYRPVMPGDALTLTTSLESVEDKGSGATYRLKIGVAGGDGEPVTDMLSTIFVRGGGSGEPRPRGPRPEPPARGELVSEFDRLVAGDMPVRYAHASGDHNPIHVDDEAAKSAGLPGAINHGLGTLSLVTGGLVEHLMEGDPARLKMLRVRFTDMVFPGASVTTSVWSTEGGAFLFETAREDGAVVMSGMFELSA
jgi:acyl dehydratase